MLNVLETSWRTPFLFNNRFRKLHFGVEKDPPDAQRLLFASWVMFVSFDRLSAVVRIDTLDMAIWVRSAANKYKIENYSDVFIGYINHPTEAIWRAEDLGTILEHLAPSRWKYSAYQPEFKPGTQRGQRWILPSNREGCTCCLHRSSIIIFILIIIFKVLTTRTI